MYVDLVVETNKIGYLCKDDEEWRTSSHGNNNERGETFF